MNEVCTIILSVLLVAVGVLAELNVIWNFLSDWREGRREEREKSFQAQPKGRVHGSGTDPRRKSHRGLSACLAAPYLVAAGVHAQEATTPGHPGAAPAAADQPQALPEVIKSPFSLQLNLDFTNAYFYHGIIQEDTGLIVQPAAKLTIGLYEQDDFKVDGLLGTWNSFHGRKTGARTHGDFTDYWYESDLTAGVALTKGKASLTTTYTFMTSPSDAYETVQELDFTFAYDDSELLGKWALHPYALIGIETGADASDGADSATGTYVELGIAPGFVFDADKTPVSVSFPVTVGLSLHDYYQNAAGEDDTFGFAQVGVKGSIPLPFGDRYGKWTLNAGVSAILLGDHTAEFNGGRHEQIIGTIGVQVNF